MEEQVEFNQKDNQIYSKIKETDSMNELMNKKEILIWVVFCFLNFPFLQSDNILRSSDLSSLPLDPETTSTYSSTMS